MKVQLIAHTENPDKIVASAAKLCYSKTGATGLMEGLTDEKAERFVDMLSEIGHESPIEHASFTFAIEGVSRSLLAQITRHRMASYSVQSQRYVRLDEFNFITPPAIAEDPEASEIYLRSMQKCAEDYEKLADILKAKIANQLMAEGVPEKEALKRAEKQAIEDARFVLPNACETKMVVTMNARSLHNFFRLRCCNRAQWEIRALADAMLAEVCKVAPALFKNSGPGCVCGACPEGKMTCGKVSETRKRIAELKGGSHE